MRTCHSTCLPLHFICAAGIQLAWSWLFPSQHSKGRGGFSPKTLYFAKLDLLESYHNIFLSIGYLCCLTNVSVANFFSSLGNCSVSTQCLSPAQVQAVVTLPFHLTCVLCAAGTRVPTSCSASRSLPCCLAACLHTCLLPVPMRGLFLGSSTCKVGSCFLLMVLSLLGASRLPGALRHLIPVAHTNSISFICSSFASSNIPHPVPRMFRILPAGTCCHCFYQTSVFWGGLGVFGIKVAAERISTLYRTPCHRLCQVILLVALVKSLWNWN